MGWEICIYEMNHRNSLSVLGTVSLTPDPKMSYTVFTRLVREIWQRWNIKMCTHVCTYSIWVHILHMCLHIQCVYEILICVYVFAYWIVANTSDMCSNEVGTQYSLEWPSRDGNGANENAFPYYTYVHIFNMSFNIRYVFAYSRCFWNLSVCLHIE